jgi:hypothetical protein
MKRARFAACILILASLALLAGWRSPASGAKHGLLAAGDWGGEHISMKVTASGAELDFDCASARITSAIELDAKGRFDVDGEFHPEHGGPERRDEEPSTAPAHFTGRLSGNSLSLSITLTNGKEPLGEYNLVKGSVGRVLKCR